MNGWQLSKKSKFDCKVYFKYFSGATTDCMKDCQTSYEKTTRPFYSLCGGKWFNLRSNIRINSYIYHTAWRESKYGVFSGFYFPVLSPNKRKYGPEKLRIGTLVAQCYQSGIINERVILRHQYIINYTQDWW